MGRPRAGDRIQAAGPASSVSAPGATVVDLPGTTLLPGLVEGHSHVLLHPYDETKWNDQVLHESLGVRTARAVNHLRATLMAGFTTIRDLGTEGAGYADAELKQAVEQGIMPGPRMLVATRAIVATGSYGPKGFALEWRVPQGAEEADDTTLVRVVRDQIGHGADWIKVYADYRWGARGEAAPTFSIEELKHDRRDRPEQRPARGRARGDGRGHAPRHPGRSGNHRARRRRHARRVQADEGEKRRLSVRRSRRATRPRSTPAGQRDRPRSPQEFRASARASRPRSMPASQSSAAATSACSPTATTRARSS